MEHIKEEGDHMTKPTLNQRSKKILALAREAYVQKGYRGKAWSWEQAYRVKEHFRLVPVPRGTRLTRPYGRSPQDRARRK